MNKLPLSHLHPRPNFVRNPFILLNGEWDFMITKSKKLLNKFNHKILVPYSVESTLSKIKKRVYKDDYLHYHKVINIKKSFNKGRVILNFNAVDQVCYLYINRKLVGKHEGGYIPFSFDITDKLEFNGKDEIYLIVNDDTDSDIYARGKQCSHPNWIFYTPTSGIWQSVFIESVPLNYIKSYVSKIDYDNKTIEFNLNIIGKINNLTAKISFKNKLIKVLKVKGSSFKIKLNDMKSWSPSEPNLYDVTFIYKDDEIKTYFGMRKYSILKIKNKKVFALNNKPILLKGVLDQGYYLKGILTPENEKELENDILIMKQMGFNMLRKHIKIELPLFYYYCDKYGMCVFQDMVSGGKDPDKEYTSTRPDKGLSYNDHNYKHLGRNNPMSRKRFIVELKETYQYLRNTACICGWTIFNEAWGQFDSKEITKILRNLDSTRYIDSCSGWYDQGAGDCNSKHIYIKDNKPLKMVNDKKRVAFLSEFGGCSYYIKNHSYSDLWFGIKKFTTKEEMFNNVKDLFLNGVLSMIKENLLSGFVYTQLSDVETETNGLMTYDRKIIKIDINKIKALNDKLDKAFILQVNH